jgi:signal transduction histidine kinase
MRLGRIIALITTLLLIGCVLIVAIYRSPLTPGLDVIAVNDIAESLAERWGQLEPEELPGLQYGLDYVVLDTDGNKRTATRKGLAESLTAAIGNRDTIVDIARDGQPLGKLLLHNPSIEQEQQDRHARLISLVTMLLLVALFCVAYALYLNRTMLRPFRKLQAFARHVAMGNLDLPLEVERGNPFGAFTESFDLMREELGKARENERAANQSKKELVASLSHDIKTPVASIKAVSEIMMVKAENPAEHKQLAVINAKADQINTLITNLFSATLAELQQLEVTQVELTSLVVTELIQEANYNGRAAVAAIPECIILADRQRLLQVIDNILSNAAKYAGTAIEVTGHISGAYLELDFRDYGSGVPDHELPLLTHKFYRGGNAARISGAGLGLSICQDLMSKMSGGIQFRNTGNGFAVLLLLQLV